MHQIPTKAEGPQNPKETNMGVRKNHAIRGARQLSAYFRSKGKIFTVEEYVAATDAPIAPAYLMKNFRSYPLALEWTRKVDPTIFVDLAPAPKPAPAPKAAPKPKPAPKAKVKKDDE